MPKYTKDEMRGWWYLNSDTPLNDIDREHIAKMIKEGYTCGEVLHEPGDTENDIS